MSARIIGVTAVVLLAGCDKPTEQPSVDNKTAEAICHAGDSMPGGWIRSDETPEVRKAVQLVIRKMDKPARLKRVLAVHSQIVNGVNYALEYQLENGTIWSAIVYRDLEGKYAITQRPIPGLFCDH